ncbi:tripartite tricarboxylate transporter TctB family protein [Halomonas sp. V046]|uniref:tripartite tricarboxylate transporter TctB family protein n=1 Tax=Halomonas sp. V046 TaxID=3459611 RepID=UPI00404495D6
MHAKVSLFAIAILLLALGALVPTLQFPSSEDVSTFIGPRLWPLMLLIILLGLGGLLLATNLRQARRDTADAAPARQDTVDADLPPSPAPDTDRGAATVADANAEPSGWAATRHWWLMAITLAYTLLMPVTGYLIATLAFALVATWLLGARHWGAIVITLAVAGLMIQGVFAYLLGIPLP